MIREGLMATTNYDMFNLFDALTTMDVDDVLAAKIENSCSFFCNSVDAAKHVAQTCSTGSLTKEALVSISEYAPGLIKEPAIVRNIIYERKMLWPEFTEQLRLDL